MTSIGSNPSGLPALNPEQLGQIAAAGEKSATVAQVQTAVGIFHSHLKMIEKLPIGVGVANPVGTADEIRASYAEAEQFLSDVAGRAAAYSKSKDKAEQALAGGISLLKRQVHAIKIRTGAAAATVVSPGAEQKFEARLLGWFTQKAEVDHHEPLHQEDIETYKRVYSELADGPEKEQLLALINEYEIARKLVDEFVPRLPEGSPILSSTAYQGSKSEAVSKTVRTTAKALTDLMLTEIKQYPGFLQLLTEDVAVSKLFQVQVIRDGLPLAVFVKHPSVAQFLRNSGSLERSLKMAGDGKGIVIRDDHLPAVRVDGQWTKVQDLPGFDGAPDRMKTTNTGNWYHLGMNQASKTLSQVYADQNGEGFIHTPEKGLVRFNPRTWSNYNQVERQWQPVNLHTGNWWEQLPVYRSEKTAIPAGQSGHSFNYVVSHTEDGLQLGGTHAFSEIGVPVLNEHGQPVLDENGLATVNYYQFGLFAHFFEGNNKAMQNIRGELFCIDQDNTNPDRRRTTYSHPISAADMATAFETVKWERTLSLLQAGLVQKTDGAVVSLHSLIGTNGQLIDLSLAGLKMNEDGKIVPLPQGEETSPIFLADFLSQGFVELAGTAQVKFTQQADGSIALKPVFNLAYNNCSGFVKRLAASVGIDVALKVGLAGTDSGIVKFVIKVLTALRFLMDFLCWILGSRDSANDPLKGNQEHFRGTGELENPYSLVQLAKLKNELARLKSILKEDASGLATAVGKTVELAQQVLDSQEAHLGDEADLPIAG